MRSQSWPVELDLKICHQKRKWVSRCLRFNLPNTFIRFPLDRNQLYGPEAEIRVSPHGLVRVTIYRLPGRAMTYRRSWELYLPDRSWTELLRERESPGLRRVARNWTCYIRRSSPST